MKLRTVALISLLLIFVMTIFDVEARGGRGGGGRGGGGKGGGGRSSVSRGGGSRGGASRSGSKGSRGSNIKKGNNKASRSYSRAPTMSRSQASRNRPSQLPSKGERPSVKPGQGGNRPSQGVRPGQGRPGQGGIRNNSRDNAKRFLRDARGNKFDRGTLDQRKKDFQANRGERDRRERSDSRHARDRIKDNWHGYNNWFNRDFFDHHHYHPYYWNSNVNWWRAATWGGLAGWLSWGWNYPVYYENGYYPIEVTSVSYAQPETYVVNPPAVNGAPSVASADVEGDWYPLGVFAVGKNAQLAANSFMFVQLAINKNGDIAGTYYNAATDQNHEIVGSVDKDTQQAAWELADNPNSPVMSTGLYNLTREMTEVAVDFPDGEDQTWTYVRIER
jgi:hypothetical protein